MPAEDDRELIRRFQKGDESAFNELVRKYQKSIYQIARRLLGSHEEAEDLSQEVFIKAYRGLAGFRSDAGFFTWIYRITVNSALNVLRKKKLRQILSLENVGFSIASRSAAPDQQIEKEEALQAISRAINRLPKMQKIVFTLRHDQKLTHKEIAQILNRDEGTVKANYHHAIRKLKKAVKS